jgi:hypothetical protein
LVSLGYIINQIPSGIFPIQNKKELQSLLIPNNDAQAQLSYAFTFPKYFLSCVCSSLLSYTPILLHSLLSISCSSSFIVKLIEHTMPAKPAPKGHLSLTGTIPCLSINREPDHTFVAIIVQDSQIAEFWLHETHSFPSHPSSFAMPCGLVG